MALSKASIIHYLRYIVNNDRCYNLIVKYKSGFIIPLVIIIIAALAIGGGIYIHEKNKKIAEQAIVNSDADLKVTNTTSTDQHAPPCCKETSAKPDPYYKNLGTNQSQSSYPPTEGWRTFTNEQYRFSFQYPSNINFVLSEKGVLGHLDPPKDANLIQFLALKSEACSNLDSSTGPNGVHNYKGETRIINGISFHKAELGEGYAGGRSYTLDYYTIHNSFCYDIQLFESGYASSLSESETKSLFDSIATTFRFTN